jgi:hypothetical protein
LRDDLGCGETTDSGLHGDAAGSLEADARGGKTTDAQGGRVRLRAIKTIAGRMPPRWMPAYAGYAGRSGCAGLA